MAGAGGLLARGETEIGESEGGAGFGLAQILV